MQLANAIPLAAFAFAALSVEVELEPAQAARRLALTSMGAIDTYRGMGQW